MASFEGIGDSSTAVRNWLIRNADKVPEHLQERLSGMTGTGTSPVDLIITFTEAVYANQKDFPKEAKDLAAACADVAEANGYHGFDEDQKGSRISKVLSGQKVAEDKLPPVRQELASKSDTPLGEEPGDAR